MNILLINHIIQNDDFLTVGGVEYHRMVKPHIVLKRVFPEYEFVMSHSLEAATESNPELLSKTDLVLYSRNIPVGDSEKIKALNIPLALDLDDYWHLPEHHILYEDYIEHKKPESIIRSITEADFVICTTPILAEKIKEHNPNVHVVENGIDTEDAAWQPGKKKSDRIRFGFTQGNTHLFDINSIAPSVRKCHKEPEFKRRAQLVLTGFRASKDKNLTIEQIYEKMLTDNLELIKGETQQLHDLNRNHESKVDSPYKRIYMKDVREFGTVYDDIDVCVAPLEENEFNACKSELKMIEAGFKDCAIMLHHVPPYTLLATDENSFDLKKKPFDQWAKEIIRRPEMVIEKQYQLRKDVEKYDLKNLSLKRNEIYKQYGRTDTKEIPAHNG